MCVVLAEREAGRVGGSERGNGHEEAAAAAAAAAADSRPPPPPAAAAGVAYAVRAGRSPEVSDAWRSYITIYELELNDDAWTPR